MVINRLSILVSDSGMVSVSSTQRQCSGFRRFQEVSGSAVSGHGKHHLRRAAVGREGTERPDGGEPGLAAGRRAITTHPCIFRIFSVEKHYGNIEGGARMTLRPMASQASSPINRRMSGMWTPPVRGRTHYRPPLAVIRRAYIKQTPSEA